MTKRILPGLVDVHVHFREPGGAHKEDFGSGTRAALAGGISTVLEMPNTSPPTVGASTFSEKARIAGEKAHCDYGLFLGAEPANVDAAADLAPRAAGLKVYMGETFGPLIMTDLPALVTHFARWPGPGPIAVHAEGAMMAAAIALARAFGRPTHLCHVSTAAEMKLIRKSREAGAPITCEVAPHHLFLTEGDEQRLGPLAQMRPPLGTAADQAALWENLELIDIFASDHAPHTLEEKEGQRPPPGVPGVETMLPLLLTAVEEGRLSLEGLVHRLHHNPARIFGLRLAPAETEIDPDAPWTIDAGKLMTRCGWTPFDGMGVQGCVRRVTIRGQTAYADGQVLAPAGEGRDVRAG